MTEDLIDSANQKWNDSDHEGAINDYLKAIDINPSNWKAYFEMGQVYDELEDWDASLNCYSNAIKINPRNPELYVKRGIYYHLTDNFSSAKNDLEKALELQPENIKALEHLVDNYRKEMGYEEAIKFLDVLIKSNPKNANAYRFRAGLKRFCPNPSLHEAIEDYTSSININPIFLEFHKKQFFNNR